jgi:hypothetical protein
MRGQVFLSKGCAISAPWLPACNVVRQWNVQAGHDLGQSTQSRVCAVGYLVCIVHKWMWVSQKQFPARAVIILELEVTVHFETAPVLQ